MLSAGNPFGSADTSEGKQQENRLEKTPFHPAAVAKGWNGAEKVPQSYADPYTTSIHSHASDIGCLNRLVDLKKFNS